MIEIKIDATQLNIATEQLRQRIEDPEPLMEAIGSLLESTAQEAFRSEGPGWADLAESTKAQRAKTGHWPGQKLVRKGGNNGLLGSLFSDHGSDWAHVGAGSGPSAAYALIHQKGGQAGRGLKTTIPARPYLPITADDELTPEASDSALAIVMEYLKS
jgi:phage virion morphogenesis protein